MFFCLFWIFLKLLIYNDFKFIENLQEQYKEL